MKLYFLACLVALIPQLSFSEVTLKIMDKTFTREELLQRSDIEDKAIEVPAYNNQKISFKMIQASKLFGDYQPNPNMGTHFECTDGYSGPVNIISILNSDPSKSVAYIAIEDPNAPWPNLPKKEVSAGPFFLVWMNTGLSGIEPKDWPYQLAGLIERPKLEYLYPNIFPKDKSNLEVMNGFKVYQKTCMNCHQVNKEGPGSQGPDLNMPMNPTEFFRGGILQKYIRDPQSVRSWPEMKMPSFDEKSISDSDLNDLVEYLKAKAAEKAQASDQSMPSKCEGDLCY